MPKHSQLTGVRLTTRHMVETSSVGKEDVDAVPLPWWAVPPHEARCIDPHDGLSTNDA